MLPGKDADLRNELAGGQYATARFEDRERAPVRVKRPRLEPTDSNVSPPHVQAQLTGLSHVRRQGEAGGGGRCYEKMMGEAGVKMGGRRRDCFGSGLHDTAILSEGQSWFLWGWKQQRGGGKWGRTLEGGLAGEGWEGGS